MNCLLWKTGWPRGYKGNFCQSLKYVGSISQLHSGHIYQQKTEKIISKRLEREEQLKY